MKHSSAFLLPILWFAVAGSWGQQRESRNAQLPADFADRYGVLVERNIFLRDRAGARSAAQQPAAVPLSPEQSVMLTGIVFEQGEFRAYFENVQESTVLRTAPGDTIARGQITQIMIDAVAYQNEDGLVNWIEIGHDLTGARAVAATTPAAGASDAALLNADPSSLSIEERLRQNRLRELNRN